MTLEFASELYERELARREHLVSAVSLPAGILALVGGLLGAVANDFTYSNKVLTAFFAVALIMAAACFAWSLWNLLRAHVGHVYEFLPRPKTLHEFYLGTLAHYRDEPDPPVRARVDFDDLLLRRYVEAAEKNTNTNDRKSEILHQANRALASAMVLALLCGVLHAIDMRMSAQERRGTAEAGVPHKVEVVGYEQSRR